jgi:hypothetical protein
LHPVIEFIFNTPSHHRVHHGRNPKYIDKNHGGTLIIFDRLFGTFQREEEEVIYGVTKPLASWNPVWANVDYYADLVKASKPMRTVDRLKMLWAAPGWMPEAQGGFQQPKEIDPDYVLYNTSVPVRLNYYVLIQFVLTLGVTTWFLFNADQLPVLVRLVLSAWVILSILSLGGIFELRKWALYSELFRQWGLLVVIFLFRIEPVFWVSIAATAIMVPSFLWFLGFRKYFIKIPPQATIVPGNGS